MKKLLLFISVNFFITFFVQAQTQLQKPLASQYFDTLSRSSAIFKGWQLHDSLINPWQKKNPPIDRMPVLGSMPKRFIYLGNNQKGFDVYQTMQDNMRILKPDSTFASNMPVRKVPVTGEKK
jgi:hypothetical protein